MATELYAQAEEADSAIRQNPGNLPKSYQPAHRRSDRNDQSDPAWLGELLSGWQFELLLRHDQRLGGEEGTAASDACQTTSGIRLETMEYELALRPTGSVQRLSSAAPQARTQSRSSTLGPITLGRKQTGAPSAGNPHAGCEEAGTGNRLTDRLVRHSQRKRRATDRSVLRSTAPVLDPTTLLLENACVELLPVAGYRDSSSMMERSKR